MRTVNEEARRAKTIEMMETTFDCYAENGFASVGIKAIADACGCSGASLYQYFDNLDDLIIQSTEYCMSKVEDEFMKKAATVTETGNTEYWHCSVCGKYFADENGTDEIAFADTVIAKLPPEIVEGKGQSVTEGEKHEITFQTDDDIDGFIRIEIDGVPVDTENYSLTEDGTITLNADYVGNLSAGKHTIGVVSEGGTATTTFTVNAKAVVNDDKANPAADNDTADNEKKSPKTGDNSHMALWIALLFVSG